MASELEKDPVEREFVERLRADPGDDQARLVYADFLEERGRSAQCEFLRLQVELRQLVPSDARFEQASGRLRQLAGGLDLSWRRVVSTAPIEACDDVRFDFSCPRQWASLRRTDDGDAVRFCDSCNQNVHYCTSIDEANTHAHEGRCVVIDLMVVRVPGDLGPVVEVPVLGMMPPLEPTMGVMLPPDPPKKRSWWRRLLGRD